MRRMPANALNEVCVTLTNAIPLEEKLQPVQCRDPEPSRFAHNLQNRKWSLSCFSGSASLGRPFRLIEDLRVIHVVTSGFGVLVALAHVIKVFDIFGWLLASGSSVVFPSSSSLNGHPGRPGERAAGGGGRPGARGPGRGPTVVWAQPGCLGAFSSRATLRSQSEISLAVELGAHFL